jgi:hypothetical protein
VRRRARDGVDSALEYLVGEKLMHFAQAAEERAEFVAELPAFAREVRSIFSLRELEAYFAKLDAAELDAAELELADDDPDAQDPLPEEERAEAFRHEQGRVVELAHRRTYPKTCPPYPIASTLPRV